MLCQFSVTNYKCFKNTITLDMQSTAITENQERLIKDVDNESFLPLAVIYGANASGKSTVLSALFSLAAKIMLPICSVSHGNDECMEKIKGIHVAPYKFSKRSNNLPTVFELFFRTKKYEYQYKLSVLKGEIYEEILYKKLLTGSRYSLVFSRNANQEIVLSGSFKSYDAKGISQDLTLLSFFGITHKRNSIIKDIVNWFSKGIEFVNFSANDENIILSEDNKKNELFLKMLRELDTNIEDYRIEEIGEDKIRIFTIHEVGGVKYELALNEESSGTKKLFSVLGLIIESILNGATLVVDELDAKLHPSLLKYIISLYTDKSINLNGSQLIFTSHDLSTMTSEVFRRDEVWFVAKNQEQESTLYSLVEFKQRKDVRKYSERYLDGKYGADPYLKKLINWEEYK